MSHFTAQSTTSLVHRHDGHHEGFLNCLAIRHGWTRTFSIAPGELANLDYAQLERILELNTLRLRPYMVRVFVEEPAGSGTFAKVRLWKDDGSLQSVLVKEFFERRMYEGGIITFELRDGRDRAEDDTDAESAFASKTSLALAKLRRRKTRDASTASTPASTPSAKTGTARFFDFFRFPRSIKPMPPPSTHDIPLVLDEDDDDEEDLTPRAADPEELAQLQRRGWVPPLLRRIAGQASSTNDSGATSSIRRRSKGKGPDVGDVEPGEEDAVALSEEEWEVQESTPDAPAGPNGIGRPALFARLSGRNKEEQAVSMKKSKNKNKNKNKGPKGAKAFQGAERVQRPEDAMPLPPPKDAGPSAAQNPFDD